MPSDCFRGYFTDGNPTKYVGYTGAILLLGSYAATALLEPLINPARCDPHDSEHMNAWHLGGNDPRPEPEEGGNASAAPPAAGRAAALHAEGAGQYSAEFARSGIPAGGRWRRPAKRIPNMTMSARRRRKKEELRDQEDWPCWNINHYAGDDPAEAEEERGTLYYWCSQYPNPEYRRDPCLWERRPGLLMLTQLECDWARRLILAAAFGACIGYERRGPDRPVGIRQMVMVSIASALLTIIGVWGFISGPFEWDSSRVSAALPSGVGFLGAGVIWKDKSQVHGLTTAAGTWLSCAVGIAAGGGLYFNALFTVLLFINLVRFGPRHPIDEAEPEPAPAEPPVAPATAASSCGSAVTHLYPLTTPMPPGQATAQGGGAAQQQLLAVPGSSPPRPSLRLPRTDSQGRAKGKVQFAS
eukprot:TRINITY_DN21331_c0_g1_i1.p1 TRINITY_DN21331_c0_g1~~TRINITY_DN21331_c0_g1_i1.p1  ORF type:complete len:438 (+),score=116.24 TRINITY_DN21331_c0_g1_i1:76-1314(+)